MATKPILGVSPLVRVFADDRVGQCARCQRLVYYRPHAAAERITRRLCLECYVGTAGPNDHFFLTAESVDELRLWLQRTDGVQH